MRNGIRDWSIWLKKQTGVDGFRLDAAKHFEPWATQDFLWNLAYNASFASGGSQMYAVGEYVGSAAEIDTWVDSVNASNGGGFDLIGSFDFSLRGALKNMASSSGSFDLGSLPSGQQNRRSRTAPFVNNHDTFRPTLSANGNYTGWDTANELGGHIDPFDPRIQAAYAVAIGVDGSPNIFFEDLFDIGSTGRRWTHHPDNPTELPARDWLVNLIWCHQKLNFKDGAYRIRWQAPDLLIIERSAHAIIGVNDNWDTWQSATAQTDFGPNVQLHDYSGANGNDIMTEQFWSSDDFCPAVQRDKHASWLLCLGTGRRERRFQSCEPQHDAGMGNGRRPRRFAPELTRTRRRAPRELNSNADRWEDFCGERENGDDQRVSSILDQWLRSAGVRQLRRAAHECYRRRQSHTELRAARFGI
jgi:alpha-amylase